MAASPYDMSMSGPKIKIDYAAAKERLSKQDFTQIQLLPDKISNSGLKFFNNFADNLPGMNLLLMARIYLLKLYALS